MDVWKTRDKMVVLVVVVVVVVIVVIWFFLKCFRKSAEYLFQQVRIDTVF